MLNSILLSNIETLKQSVKSKVNYTDINADGIDSRESIQKINQECTLQKYKMWLLSSESDYHRNPGFGGFVDTYVRKRPLTDANAKLIEADLETQTKLYFPYVEIIKKQAIPDIANRKWIIKIAIVDTNTGLTDFSMFDESSLQISIK